MTFFPLLKQKKVLLVSHNLTVTGAPLLLVETGIAMAQSGADVSVTSLAETEPGFPRLEEAGLKSVEVDDSFDLASQADVIISNTAVSKEWVAKLLSLNPSAARKLIWWIHEIDIQTYGAGMECLGQAAATLFDSECSHRLWQQIGPLPAISKAVYPGVKPELLNEALRHRPKGYFQQLMNWRGGGPSTSRREEVRTRLGVRRDDFLISVIGQYCSLKGQDLLVSTIGRMLDSQPDLRLKVLLVGFADEVQRKNFLDKLSANEWAALALNRALTRVPNPSDYYLASDAFVMNTQPPGENFGLVSIEAMAFGLPVLGTDIGGTREIVIDGVTGLLHPAGEAGQEQLIANIRFLINDCRKARRLGRAGFERVRTHFDADRFYREFAEVVAHVMAHQANTLANNKLLGHEVSTTSR
jgi:glycosyltransferase involved in cell wall biosynthesis